MPFDMPDPIKNVLVVVYTGISGVLIAGVLLNFVSLIVLGKNLPYPIGPKVITT